MNGSRSRHIDLEVFELILFHGPIGIFVVMVERVLIKALVVLILIDVLVFILHAGLASALLLRSCLIASATKS
jgi:hypothetical protein